MKVWLVKATRLYKATRLLYGVTKLYKIRELLCKMTKLYNVISNKDLNAKH